MKWFMHPLLAIIAGATESELAKYIEYLKVENQILRDRLPKKIDTTEAERTKLLKVGKQLGAKMKHLVSIVSPRTFQRWVQADYEAKAAKKGETQEAAPARHGNSKPEEVHNLVLEIRKETGWGAGRIKGELYRHGYRTIARSTINRILRENGFKPEPPGDPDNTWANFLRRHASTLWACDFFTKPVLTMGGWVDYYVLFFINLETRKVHILGVTPNPNNEWMKQQARNLCVFFGELDTPPKYIIHDADTKFTRDFREMLKAEGVKPVRIGPRRPNQNAVAERFVRTIKEECLSRFLVFGEDHLRYLIDQFVSYYHTKRSHRGLEYRTPDQIGTNEEGEPVESLAISDLIRRESLGGALKWYEKKAA
jgi:putative transposase